MQDQTWVKKGVKKLISSSVHKTYLAIGKHSGIITIKAPATKTHQLIHQNSKTMNSIAILIYMYMYTNR